MNFMAMLFFRSPFWVHFALAAGIIWLGFGLYHLEVDRAAARAAMLQQEPPATIPITEFATDAPSNVPVELSVTAQLALDHNTRLVKKTKFITTSESLLYVLVDDAPGADISVAQAGIIIDPDDKDAFIAWITGNISSVGAAGPVVTVHGLRTAESHALHAYDAMEDQGMTRASGFIFIEPFIAGREAALAAVPANRASPMWPFAAGAGFFVLVGALKLRKWLKRLGLPKATPAVIASVVAATPPTRPRGTVLHDAGPTLTARKANGRSLGGKIILGLLALIGMLIAFKQFWVFNYLPIVLLAGFLYGVHKAKTALNTGITGLVDAGLAKITNRAAVPETAIPQPAAAMPSDGGPIRSGAMFARKPAAPTGPIRPGFSLSDLIPQRKLKPMPGQDPFDRLAERARAERLKSAKG